MDRKVRVINNGYLFAEMYFLYETQTTGKARVTLYSPSDLHDSDIKAVIPAGQWEEHFSHSELNSIDDIISYDMVFVNNNSYGEPVPANAEFVYDSLTCRYVLQTEEEVMGIADVSVNFTDKSKTLLFISAHRRKADTSATTQVLEHNLRFIGRTFETYSPITTIKLVDYN
jgi:hypothetical protein